MNLNYIKYVDFILIHLSISDYVVVIHAHMWI